MRYLYRAYWGSFGKDLWVLALGWFSSALGFSVSIPFISIYFHRNLGLSLSQIGLFFGLMAVVRSAFQIIGGEVSDRMERRFLLVDSQLIRAVSFLFMALAVHREWGFWAVAGFLLINSIFGAIFQPAANAMVSDILPADKHLDGFALTRSATNLGWAAGPALGGFLAAASYGLLFLISALITMVSGVILWLFLKPPPRQTAVDRFRLADLLAVRQDRNLAWHCGLTFLLYIVVAQLIAPFSVYAVDIVRISAHQLGILYTLNGLLVVLLQMPITRLFGSIRLTVQLAGGAVLYAAGYGFVGFSAEFWMFVIAIAIITAGEIIMSPPSLTLASRLAPPGKTGRYMGILGFCISSGWSLGPLYGGLILEAFAGHYRLAWLLIASLALFSAGGYALFTRRLPDAYNRRPPASRPVTGRDPDHR